MVVSFIGEETGSTQSLLYIPSFKTEVIHV